MKKQAMFVVLALALMICVAGVTAHAQDQGKFTVFGGYSYMTNSFSRSSGCGSSCDASEPSIGIHGYTTSFVYNANKHVGLEANFSGHNGSPAVYSDSYPETDNLYEDIYTYTFGPKLTQPVGNFALFTHFLVGVEHAHVGYKENCSDCTDNYSDRGYGMAFKTGGGADWNHGSWGVRILEVDYIHSSLNLTETCAGCSSSDTFSFPASNNSFELATGVTFSFGK
jgi:hypothetical protein